MRLGVNKLLFGLLLCYSEVVDFFPRAERSLGLFHTLSRVFMQCTAAYSGNDQCQANAVCE